MGEEGIIPPDSDGVGVWPHCLPHLVSGVRAVGRASLAPLPSASAGLSRRPGQLQPPGTKQQPQEKLPHPGVTRAWAQRP